MRAATQYERDLMVMSYLDITLGQMLEAFNVRGNEVDGGPLDEYLAKGFSYLSDSLEDAHGAYQLYLQNLASMSDRTLFDVITFITNKPPFEWPVQ